MYKRYISLPLICLVLCTMLMPMAQAIDTKASHQISSYRAVATSGENGAIYSTFSVICVPEADALGAENISISMKLNNRWVPMKQYDRDDAGMSETNTSNYGNTITYYGTTGMDYKVEITVFAEDADGYDSRTQTHYVTAK